jgi:hypothetical protein
MLEIRRREFIAGLGGAAAWPVAAPGWAITNDLRDRLITANSRC